MVTNAGPQQSQLITSLPTIHLLSTMQPLIKSPWHLKGNLIYHTSFCSNPSFSLFLPPMSLLLPPLSAASLALISAVLSDFQDVARRRTLVKFPRVVSLCCITTVVYLMSLEILLHNRVSISLRFIRVDKSEDELEMTMVCHRPEGLEQLEAQTNFTKQELQILYRGFKNVRV